MEMKAVLVVWTVLVLCCRSAVQGKHVRRSNRARPRRMVMDTRPTEYMWGTSGSFSSPNYPQRYPLNVEKNYVLMMPRQSRNYTVQLTFSTLDIEQEMNCNWDYLGWGPAIGSIDKRICGQMPRPYLVYHVENRLAFKFYSDYMVVGNGFHVTYNITKEPDACDYWPCLNNGTCTPTSFGLLYNCTCPFGINGNNCEHVDQCAYSPCLHNGTCHQMGNSYNCSCVYPYTGQNCNETVNACDSSPCANGSTCWPTNGTYYCYCPPGRTGWHCEDTINACDSSPCTYGSTCWPTNGTFYCYCAHGWTGRYCEDPMYYTNGTFNSTQSYTDPMYYTNGTFNSTQSYTDGWFNATTAPPDGWFNATTTPPGYNPYYVLSKLMLSLNHTDVSSNAMQRVLAYLIQLGHRG